MDVAALTIGFALVWLFGTLLVASIAEREPVPGAPGRLAWLLGTGWLTGAFVLTLWMRALSLGGVAFGVAAIGGPLLLATLMLGWLVARRATRPVEVLAAAARGLTGRGLDRWQRIGWFVLLGWLALRYALLLGEVLWRPLYPWDAWAQWATKARVWYELRTMVPFLPLSDWLAAGGAAYTDPTPHYPATVPLLQVWGATLLGRWDDSLVNLPWWLTGVALALAVYGFLAQQGLTAVGALAGAWLVSSLPILNVHVALAGYADLPMAAWITVGVLAGMRWLQSRQWRDALPALLLLVAWVTIKNPGKAWLLVLLPALVVALLPRHGIKVAAMMLAVAAAGLAVLAQTSMTVLGYRLHLDFNFPARGLWDAYFAYGNWHLLWYGLIGVVILGWRQALSRDVLPLTIAIGGGLLFLLFGFAFTSAGAWVEDQTTVNRATLHVAPLIMIWMILVFRQWARGPATDQTSSGALARPAAPTAPGAPAISATTPTADAPPAERNGTPEPPAEAKPPGQPLPVVGRNDPCPCGSGKRYKECHGNLVATAGERPIVATAAAPPATSADALVRAGMAVHRAGDLGAAERNYRAALAMTPAHPFARHYLGVVAYQRGQLDVALPLLEQTAAAVPQEAEFHNNLGLALAEVDRVDEAIAAYRRVLALKPDHANAWSNLGLAFRAANALPEAIDAYRRAIALAPGLAQAHWNLSLALLAHGEFAEGWREFEWRLAISEFAMRPTRVTVPRWNGVPLPGQTVLLTCESGVDDAIQFARFARHLSAVGLRVQVAAPRNLVRLLATVPGVAGAVCLDDPPPACDAFLPLLSTPGVLGIDASTIPGEVPYLTADPERRVALAAQLATGPDKLKVGLAWAGDARQPGNAHRCVPLAVLAPLFAVANVAWLSLQQGETAGAVTTQPAAQVLEPLPDADDLDDTAARIAELDLVISVDTSVAHLAGALGRPVWILLPHAPDWRWQLERADSPWYPTARLFRQPRRGDWEAVVRDVAAALADRVATRRLAG